MDEFVKDYNKVVSMLNHNPKFQDLIRLSATYNQMKYVSSFFDYASLKDLRKKQYMKRFDINKDFIDSASFHADVAQKILYIIKSINFTQSNLNVSNDFNLKNYKDIIFDCYNNFDPNAYKVIKKVFDDNSIYRVDLTDCDGMCVNAMPLKKNYIFLKLKEKQNISSFITLCHELGHAYENKLFASLPSKLDYKRAKNIYNETYSLLFENLMYDYLIKNNIVKNDAIIDQNDMMFFYTNELFKRIYTISTSIINDTWYMENKTFYTNVKSKYSDEYGNLNVADVLPYAYGFIFSKYFENIIKKDPKEGKKLLDYFIKIKDSLSTEDIFKDIKVPDNLDFIQNTLNENKQNVLSLKK